MTKYCAYYQVELPDSLYGAQPPCPPCGGRGLISVWPRPPAPRAGSSPPSFRACALRRTRNTSVCGPILCRQRPPPRSVGGGACLSRPAGAASPAPGGGRPSGRGRHPRPAGSTKGAFGARASFGRLRRPLAPSALRAPAVLLRRPGAAPRLRPSFLPRAGERAARLRRACLPPLFPRPGRARSRSRARAENSTLSPELAQLTEATENPIAPLRGAASVTA